MPRRAVVMLRPTLHYRKEAFEQGLQRLGYQISDKPSGIPQPGDIIVFWNRNKFQEHTARRYENRRAIVIVAENGYLGRDEHGGKLFALAKRFHNGAGVWKTGDPERWKSQHITVQPWRKDGDFILVLPQRGIGPTGVAMPERWSKLIEKRLQARTKRPIRIRHHPGNDHGEPYKDLRNAWAVVTWGSGAALKAIAHGIPAFHEMPQWIGAPAATLLDKKKFSLEKPFLGDRLPMLERLAWAQFATSEIASGYAFEWLLQ